MHAYTVAGGGTSCDLHAGTGTYLWDCTAGTWFWIDPQDDIVFIGMIQRMMAGGGMPSVRNLAGALVQQALVSP